jgi:hypothetical protein
VAVTLPRPSRDDSAKRAEPQDRGGHRPAGHGAGREQHGPDPLIPFEPFSAGGADTVRGYPTSELVGDYGAQAELTEVKRTLLAAVPEERPPAARAPRASSR